MLRLPSGRLFVGVLLSALFAMLLGALATSWGAGLTPDTVLYLETSDSLRAGEGFPLALMDGGRLGAAIPPLYPLALSVVGAGLDAPSGARWLNVFLYGFNVFIFAGILAQLTRSSLRFTLAGALLAALSLVMLECHTAAWSEPLFLALMLGGIHFLARYFQSEERGELLWAGVLIGLSATCRYAGVACIGASLMSLLYLGPKSWRDRALSFCLTAGPLAGVIIWNRLRNGSSAEGGSFQPHWPGPDLLVLSNTIAAWIIPGIDRFQIVTGQDFLAIGLTVIWLLGLARAAHLYRELRESKLYQTLLVFSVTYPFVLLVLIAFVKSDLPLEQRIMAPLHLTLLLMTLASLYVWHENHSRDQGLTPSVLLLFWVLLYLPPALYGTYFMAQNGRGYLGASFRAPKIYEKVRELNPPGVHSNDGGAIWLWLRTRNHGLQPPLEHPVIFYRVHHPLPPRHEAGTKREGVPTDFMSRLIEETPLYLELKEGSVELYLPQKT